MKKLLVVFLFLMILSVVGPAYAVSNFYWRPCLSGAGCLDSIDGTGLAAGDAALVLMDSGSSTPVFYVYRGYASSGTAASPNIIAPSANAGTFRWHLVLGPNLLWDAAGAHTLSISKIDDTVLICDDGDATKCLAFQVSGVAGSTTRTMTIGDYASKSILATDVDASGHITGGPSGAFGTMIYATATDYVTKALFDAYSILYADSDNTPAPLTVGASTIVGRKATGGIVALTGAEALVIAGAAATTHTLQYSATPVIDDPDNFAANFTGDNLYGGTFIANAAGTAALPNPAAGMNFTIVLETTGAVIIDPLGTGTADTIYMNGLAAAQDENITSSTRGAMCVFQYRSADTWMATCNGFVEATPP